MNYTMSIAEILNSLGSNASNPIFFRWVEQQISLNQVILLLGVLASLLVFLFITYYYGNKQRSIKIKVIQMEDDSFKLLYYFKVQHPTEKKYFNDLTTLKEEINRLLNYFK